MKDQCRLFSPAKAVPVLRLEFFRVKPEGDGVPADDLGSQPLPRFIRDAFADAIDVEDEAEDAER